jgi:hypothetical protein
MVESTERIGGFISFLDERGLTGKAQRVRSTESFINDINKQVKDLLDQLDVTLFTDPGTIIASKYFSNLDEIIDTTFKIWDEVNFPLRETLYIRTSGFNPNQNFNYPFYDISIKLPRKEILKNLNDFLDKNKPEQIILHPRIDTELAKKQLIAFRPTSIAGDILCEFGMGGIYHIRNMETAEIYQSFELNKISLEEINPIFLPYAKAFSIISGFADEYIKKYTQSNNPTATPVYELKCFTINNKHYMNLFDYEYYN